MRTRHAVAAVVLGSATALTLSPASAAAQYLDPGAGSIIVQATIAIVVGLAATLKLYWRQISAYLSSHRSKGDKKP